MTFETMDWETEAKRVKVAFGIAVPCEFRKTQYQPDVAALYRIDIAKRRLPLCDGTIAIQYAPKGRSFSLFHGKDVMGISIDWNDQIINFLLHDAHVADLAKGLFYLDLLKPQVETILQVTISAHQKLEWTLEYAKRLEAEE